MGRDISLLRRVYHEPFVTVAKCYIRVGKVEEKTFLALRNS